MKCRIEIPTLQKKKKKEKKRKRIVLQCWFDVKNSYGLEMNTYIPSKRVWLVISFWRKFETDNKQFCKNSVKSKLIVLKWGVCCFHEIFFLWKWNSTFFTLLRVLIGLICLRLTEKSIQIFIAITLIWWKSPIYLILWYSFHNSSLFQSGPDANLNRFQGSSSISSAEYFGRQEVAPGRGLQTPDMEDVKESVRQGVSKVAGRLSNMASGALTQLQVHFFIILISR